jgi:tetratricopeptide (TPR) repeat protein
MGLFTSIKARKASLLINKGDNEGAMKLYAEAEKEGLKEMNALLAYSVLLIRAAKFQEARELLVKIQKYPMNEDHRRQLMVNYASVAYKLGNLEKGVELLERMHQKGPSGMVYQTLGYLYVEAGNYEKAVAYNLEALEYDDEDAITLDNLGQAYYRLGNEKEKAKEYFEKALKIKPSQIDTLYFLAQYDIEAGDKAAAKAKLEKAMDGRFSPLNHATREMVESLLKTL